MRRARIHWRSCARSSGIRDRPVTIDLLYLGYPRAVACALLEGRDPVLVDPGPASTLPVLRAALEERGLSVRDVAHILLTHIHLDHAGGTGTLLRENPDIMVHVHESGARHVIDPSRLLASALRIYGDALARNFGEVAPVDAARVRVLQGGETLELGSRTIDVAYTPGHARHHVSFLERASRTAFIGDTGGIRNGTSGPVAPVTPPPDIDLEQWSHSLDLISAWKPERLFLTHFGEIDDPDEHVAALRDALADWTQRVRASLNAPGDDEERARAFADEVAAELRERYGESADWYVKGGDFASSWVGLARWLRG